MYTKKFIQIEVANNKGISCEYCLPMHRPAYLDYVYLYCKHQIELNRNLLFLLVFHCFNLMIKCSYPKLSISWSHISSFLWECDNIFITKLFNSWKVTHWYILVFHSTEWFDWSFQNKQEAIVYPLIPQIRFARTWYLSLGGAKTVILISGEEVISILSWEKFLFLGRGNWVHEQ